MDFLLEFWETVCAIFTKYVAEPFTQITVLDVIDILSLAIVLYELYRFFRSRRAGRVLLGAKTYRRNW